MSSDPWGASPWPVWRQNLRDRLAGAHARANARSGFLRKPPGRGRIIWIKAGGTAQSLRLGVELLGAIRQKRHDVRLVLTFERDDEAILAPRLGGMRRVGLGYGPSDRPRTVRRVMERLEPYGLILADALPYPNLLREAAAGGVRCAAYNTDPWPVPVEAAYPRDAVQHAAWTASGRARHLAPAADPASLWAEAQADVTLRTLSGAGETGRLWWWHGPAARWSDWVAAWQSDARFREDRLFVSVCEQAPESSPALPRISEWDRTPLAPGCVVWVDDRRWLAAVASACHAGHLEAADNAVLWQALAGGRPLSVGTGAAAMAGGEVLPLCEASATVLDRWAGYADDPMAARRDGDAGRRRFWEERRGVESVMSEFLQRVFDW
ncbi:hypothetical protein [Thioalkalivibrio denitrificans]|uniref:hypothetical protein n=1 Tax=Thioalkalivibrio denitrificans TaxID=108003 RepID=UPI001FE6E757|nr:hypothetical protein [Thioalkalivibrio denitrificans]